MSRSGVTVLPFMGDERRFRMAIGDLEALQEKLSASPFAVYERLHRGVPMLADVTETIRIALVGGGMGVSEAAALMRRWREEGPPLAETLPLAQALLGIGIYGPPEEPPGKSPGPTAADAASAPVH